jgi:lactate dehydrogenase-like 2-hydroxyacid dehydrogenase
MHVHDNADEHFIILEGAAFIANGDRRAELAAKDDVFQRLLTFPNVIVTAHQAFFTKEALVAIAEVTLQNIAEAFLP